MSLEFDKIGKWSEIKLEIINQYAVPYMKIMRSHGFKAHYIDGFSGPGLNKSKDSGDIVTGSPLRVLGIPQPFDTYHFIDLDGDRAQYLDKFCKKHFPDRDFKVIEGDCNEEIMKILPKFSRKNFDRLFCLLDPYGLHLHWKIIKKMGEIGIVDLILNFPIMDMNRNAIWHDSRRVSPDGINRMNNFWGDETWKKVAYKKNRQEDIFGDSQDEKQSNKIIVQAFKKRLKEHGKFKFVPDPIPMKNTGNATIYYLFFASQNETANTIASYLFKKYSKQI